MIDVEPWRLDTSIHLTGRILWSFAHWTGYDLIPAATDPTERAQALFSAPFAVLAAPDHFEHVATGGREASDEIKFSSVRQGFDRVPSDAPDPTV